MDLKDYLRVIRRRWFEFLLVFTIIFVMYMFVSKTEQTEYIASSVLQVGSKGYDDSARNKQTFLRNHADLIALLTSNSTIRQDAAHDIVEKMTEVELLEFSPEAQDGLNQQDDKKAREEFSNFLKERQKQDPNKVPTDFYEIRPKSRLDTDQTDSNPNFYRFENYLDLKHAHAFLVNEIQIEKLNTDEGSVNLTTKVAMYLGKVSPANNDDKVKSSIVLRTSTPNKELSRLLVNELAHFAKGVYNEKNQKRVAEEAGKINLWYDDPDGNDQIERIFNGVYALYKDIRGNEYKNDDDRVEDLRDQYRREFIPQLSKQRKIQSSINTIAGAMDIDLMRQLGRELSDATARYNNLKTWGTDGNAESVIFNEAEISQSIQQLVSRIGVHRDAITKLEEDLEILRIREEELDPAERTLFRQTSARFSLIDEQIDRELIALEELKSRYTAQHPKVKETKSNISQLEELRDKLDTRLQETKQAQINFNRIEKERMIIFNKEKIDDLKDNLDKARDEMDKINDLGLHIEDVKEQRQKIRERINEQKRRLDLLKAQLGEEGIVDVHEFARVPFMAQKKYTPDTMILTIVVGMIVSIFVVYILEYMDTSIKTEHDVRRHMNLPVLSMIGKANKEVILTELPSKDPFAEHFNTAATLVRSAAQDLALKSFLVTSTVPQEGKTTICVDLAIALARKGLNIIVVDGDLRIPTIHEVLEIDNNQGLSNILEGRTGSEEFSDLDKYLQPTSIEHLRVLPSGPIPADPINLLESARMKALIEELKGKCDYLILDTPPIYNVGDTLTMASLVDATLFVVGAERVEQDQVTWAKHLLSNVNANILGVFLNMVRVPGKSYYYYYNGYKSYRSRG